MKTIAITDATASQLATYAQVQLGLEVNHRAGRDAILAKMQTVGFAKSEIEVIEEEEPVVAMTPQEHAAAPDEDKPARKYVKINIHTDSRDKNPVFASVNGRGMLIPRGQDVMVPVEYAEALEHATMDTFESGPNGGIEGPYQVPKYPFSVKAA